MALVSDQDIYDYMEEDDSTAPVPIIAILRDQVELWMAKYCDRVLESTSHQEWYDGYGDHMIILNQFPVTALSSISFSTVDSIRIYNTATYSSASVSVSSTALVLEKDGVSTSLTFSTYTTLQLLVNAVNAISGWVASVPTEYANHTPSLLIECWGQYCLDSTSVYLQMRDLSSVTGFSLDTQRGIIRAEFAIPEGERKIYVAYTAGYTDTTAPGDLKLAIKIMTKYFYQRRDEEGFGARSQSVGGISFSNEGDIPWEVKLILDNNYRKRHI